MSPNLVHAAGMAAAFTIDPATGSLRLGEVRLEPGQAHAAIAPQVSGWRRTEQDHGNGFAWLTLTGLTFGGEPADLALCFHHGRLAEASWSVRLPGMAEGEWPGPDEIDAEIEFVRNTLAGEMGLKLSDGSAQLAWGELWSDFDAKGGIAAHGLRYRGGAPAAGRRLKDMAAAILFVLGFYFLAPIALATTALGASARAMMIAYGLWLGVMALFALAGGRRMSERAGRAFGLGLLLTTPAILVLVLLLREVGGVR
ncbi:MAG: hypothetical protein ACXWUX_08280 [Allosphingosinicella sp.]